MVMESEISGLEDKIAYMKLGNRVVRFNFPYISPPKRTEAFIQRRVRADELGTKDFSPAPIENDPEAEAIETSTSPEDEPQAPISGERTTTPKTQSEDNQQLDDSSADESPEEPEPPVEDALPPNPLFEED